MDDRTAPAGEAPLGSLVAPEPDDRPDLWPATARRGADGALELGGRSVGLIMKTAPTPVFVIDRADLLARASTWSAAMAEEFWPGYGMSGGEAFYAGKAFLTTCVARCVLESGMGIDAASRGELLVALAGLQEVEGEDASRHASRIGLHGNGKTPEELAFALSHRLGHVVLDSVAEVHLAAEAVQLLRELGTYAPDEVGQVMIRLTTGVHAGGHEHISTGHEDQKFGLSIASGAAAQAIELVHAYEELNLRGLHSHIGSQILDMEGFRQSAAAVLRLRHALPDAEGRLCPEVDFGGGLGIAYTGADPVAPSPGDVARALAEVVREVCTDLGDTIPLVSVEPGRSVIGPAVITLYTVTGIKPVALPEGGERIYVSIDGGMSDNMRPALYGSAYTALLANRLPDPEAGLYRARVVGKHCESGDIVIRDVDLPADLEVGDVLAVPATGAYGRSMANNYNLFLRPGVAWVHEGDQGWALRPETYEDLFRLECSH